MSWLHTGENDLKTLYPEIAKEWHPTKNGDVTPSMVSAHNTRSKFYWLCPKGHEYYTTVHTRVNSKVGCRYCSGRAVLSGFNDLATTHPHLVSEWDLNGNDLSIHNVSAGMKDYVQWLCPKGHSYSMKILIKATKNKGCPICEGHQVLTGYNDLSTTHPKLALEWDYERNNPVTPKDVKSGSNKKYWWICKKGHRYYSDIHNRSRTVKASGCPYCSGSELIKDLYNILQEHWIYNEYSFKTEKGDFKRLSSLRYDMYIPDIGVIIEADGYQHFHQTYGDFFSYPMEKQVANDNLKNQYCLERKIPILRVPYTYSGKKSVLCGLINAFIKTHKVPEDIIAFYSRFEFGNYPEIARKLNDIL